MRGLRVMGPSYACSSVRPSLMCFSTMSTRFQSRKKASSSPGSTMCMPSCFATWMFSRAEAIELSAAVRTLSGRNDARESRAS
jgi:hypothetical protein